MRVEILGTESMGVRGMCCVVHTGNRQIVIDPGVALGYQRSGLLPHPIQVAAGEDLRDGIVGSLKTATDIVISHFHGDHMPLTDANPYQLSLASVADLLQSQNLWVKGLDEEKPRIAERRGRLLNTIGRTAPPCNGQVHGQITFSESMPHGLPDRPMGTVMMTRIEENADVFVHASDIQLLADGPVSQILDWAPTILFVSGPALYRNLTSSELAATRRRAKALADKVEVCVLDHHLLRSKEGIEWLDTLIVDTRGRIQCAADFMKQQRRFLEARRSELYQRFPVPDGWHESYARGDETTLAYRRAALTLE